MSHCQVSIARQRSEFASQTSTGPCLTASEHQVLQIPSLQIKLLQYKQDNIMLELEMIQLVNLIHKSYQLSLL